MVLAVAIVPTLGTDLPYAPAADAIALVGILALARVFISLAPWTSARRSARSARGARMMIGFLAEPALLIVLFTASLISQSTSLATTVETLSQREFAIYPSLAFAGVAFTMVSARRERAHSGRQSGDAPRTDDDSRGDGARVLRSAPRADRVGGEPEAVVYSCVGIALFFPFGIARAATPRACFWRFPRWRSSSRSGVYSSR